MEPSKTKLILVEDYSLVLYSIVKSAKSCGFDGKPSVNGGFSIAMFDYRIVYQQNLIKTLHKNIVWVFEPWHFWAQANSIAMQQEAKLEVPTTL